MTREQREAELLKMTWKAIRGIAEPLGISKPAGGWDEAIPLILNLEFPDTQEAKETDANIAKKTVTPQLATKVSPIFSTVFFKKSHIPYCKTCGASYQNDLAGMPICPISSADCDRLR